MSNENEISQLSKLLEKTLKLYEEDRKIALDIYKTFESQLSDIRDEGALMSEDAAIENAMNTAFRNITTSSKNLTTVIDALVRVITVQLNNQSRENISKNLMGGSDGSRIPQGVVDITKLLGKD